MLIIHSLEEIPPLPFPIALTVGMFDGVHLGHQFLLGELKKHGTPVVLTFSNHPSDVLPHRTSATPLCSLQERLTKLQNLGVACTIVLPFTLELSKVAYDTFLHDLHCVLPFSTLVLGEGEAFGHKCEGTPDRVSHLGKSMGYEAIYLKKITLNGEPISSNRIRSLLVKGRNEEAGKLLKG